MTEDHSTRKRLAARETIPERWVTAWYEAQAKHPWWLTVGLHEPVRDVKWISVTLEPFTVLRDQRGLRQTDRYRDGYELPVELLHEFLTNETAPRLETVTAILHDLKGWEAHQAIAWLVQIHLVVVEHHLAQQGQRSLLGGITAAELKELAPDEEDARQALATLQTAPLFSLEPVLRFWERSAGGKASRFLSRLRDIPASVSYETIPPLPAPDEFVLQARAKSGVLARAEPKVPILVDLSLEATAVSLVAALHSSRALGSPLFNANALVTARAPEPPPAEHVFRREGAVWRVTFEGSTTTLRHTKGLLYVEHLLRRPEQSVGVLELVSVIERTTKGAVRGSGSGDAAAVGLGDASGGLGPLLDDQALQELRSRLKDLDTEIEEGDEFNDSERAARAREEKAALLDSLKQAKGLGGRDRPIGSAVEQARKAVSEAIRRSLKELDREHPALAQHLRAFIQTGASLSYRPTLPPDWRF